VDAVHVLTSLAGFEALLRGRAVTCHGTPFYAGWGLTRDLAPVPARRGRALTLDALVAGVLILYPRYLDPVSGLPCPPEVLVERMARAQAINRLRWIGPLRRMQGRVLATLRGAA
jgi:capsular polysaccharide export protein